MILEIMSLKVEDIFGAETEIYWCARLPRDKAVNPAVVEVADGRKLKF